MHYKNGRQALSGDPVIARDCNGRTISGVIRILRLDKILNCDVAAVIIDGAAQYDCRNVPDMYHAEDAFVAIDKIIQIPKQSEVIVGAPEPQTVA